MLTISPSPRSTPPARAPSRLWEIGEDAVIPALPASTTVIVKSLGPNVSIRRDRVIFRSRPLSASVLNQPEPQAIAPRARLALLRVPAM